MLLHELLNQKNHIINSYKIHFVIKLLLIMSFLPLDCHADIFFGSKESGIKIDDQAVMQIATPSPMLIGGGTVANQGFGRITGQSIQFNRGIYNFFNSISEVQGVLVPDINTIQLGADANNDGGTMIANPGGLATVLVQNLPGRDILRGQPLFFGPNDLTIKDPTTILAIAVQNTVNTNITLNGGALFLQDDLCLGDDAIIVDNGTVVFNNRRLSLGGKKSQWDGRIIWDSTLDLTLNSAITLNGTWIFTGAEGQINGNGNVIDLAGGGSIIVAEDSILRLAAVQIKGLGAGGFIKLLPNSTLVLTNAVLEMDGDFNFDAGTVLVEGNSTVVTKGFIMSFVDGPNGSKGKLVVDRVGLKYDTLATIDQLNIRPALINDPNREHVEIFGNGDIGTIRQDTVSFHNYRSEGTLLKYAIVAPYRKFEIFPEVIGDSQTGESQLNYKVIVNGNTNFMGFTHTSQKIFTVTENVHATLQHITMRDLSPKHIQFDPGSHLVFGEGTDISLAENEKLDYPWIFEGNVKLYGGGKTLELEGDGEIVLRGENSVLLLDGLVLKGVTHRNIRCLRDSSKIKLRNVKWIQKGDFFYTMGALDILDDVSMIGSFVEDPINNTFRFFSFNYESTQPFTILNNATLQLTRNMNFTYAPVNAAQDLLVLADPSSALFLNQSTLAAPTGLTLSTGQLIVRDRNFISGNITFDSSLLINISSGATLEQI